MSTCAPATGERPAVAFRPLRIAFVGCKGIPALHGGIERHVEEVATRLVARGHRVDVFTRAYHPLRGHAHAGVQLRRRPSLNTKHFDAATHTALCTLEVVLSRRYDVLHVHGIGPGLFLPWASSRLHTVFTYHAQDWRQRKWGGLARRFLRRGEATAVRHADAVIAVSRLLQQYIQATYGRTAHYIPNGAAPAGPVAATTELARWGLEPQGYLLFVGRILADRGLATLLDAYRALPAPARLAVVGDVHVSAAEIAALRARADARVVFTGYQTGEALRQLYTHAVAFVHPSEIEGMPIAVLEAMAHGCPTVVSDIVENLEAVGDAGRVFPVGNPDALRVVLEDLGAHPDQARVLGERGRARVGASYNWDDIVRATERVYLSLGRVQAE